MSTPEKKVLAQDMPQYLQNTQASRERENKKIAADNAAAEKQYQSDVAAYNKQVADQKKAEADAAKQKEAEYKALGQYQDQVAKLEAQRKQELANIPVMINDKPLSNAQRKEIARQINKGYDDAEKQISIKATKAADQYYFSQAYPGVALDNTITKQYSANLQRESLISLYEKQQANQAIKAQVNRQNSIQTAVNENIKTGGYTPLQQSAMESQSQ